MTSQVRDINTNKKYNAIQLQIQCNVLETINMNLLRESNLEPTVLTYHLQTCQQSALTHHPDPPRPRQLPAAGLLAGVPARDARCGGVPRRPVGRGQRGLAGGVQAVRQQVPQRLRHPQEHQGGCSRPLLQEHRGVVCSWPSNKVFCNEGL